MGRSKTRPFVTVRRAPAARRETDSTRPNRMDPVHRGSTGDVHASHPGQPRRKPLRFQRWSRIPRANGMSRDPGRLRDLSLIDRMVRRENALMAIQTAAPSCPGPAVGSSRSCESRMLAGAPETGHDSAPTGRKSFSSARRSQAEPASDAQLPTCDGGDNSSIVLLHLESIR